MPIQMPSAKQSPRVEDGILYWYVGNTFQILWTITDTSTGQPLELFPTDVVVFKFWNRFDYINHTFSFTNLTSANEMMLDFNSEVSADFPVGKYTYCITINGEDINNLTSATTVGAILGVEVEKCH